VGELLEGVVFRGASENSCDDPEFEAEAVDDGVGWFVANEFVAAEPATGSLDDVTAGTLAAIEEFSAVSCGAGVADFLLRKRVATPKTVPTINTSMAAVFQ
jgi:hypothetical protein